MHERRFWSKNNFTHAELAVIEKELDKLRAQYIINEGDEILVSTSPVVEVEEISEEQQSQPPAAADFIITALMGSKAADGAIGDLTEIFHRNIASGMSPRNAKAKYWGEVFFLAGPMLKELAKRMGLWFLAGKLLG